MLSYYIGFKNGGDSVYSKKALEQYIEDHRDLKEMIIDGVWDYTIIKEYEKSRRFMKAHYENGKLKLETDKREVMQNGAYGN